MDRRGFLRSTLIGAGTLPALVTRAMARDAACGSLQARKAFVQGAIRAAQQDGKPLLVFLIGADERATQRRGTAFGEWLNHGDDEQIAPAALCEVAAAQASVVRSVAPYVGNPWMVLIETAPKRPRAQALDVVFATPKLKEDVDAQIDTRIEGLAKAVRKAIVPDASTVERRVAQVRDVLGFRGIERLREDIVAESDLSPARAAQGAAVVWQHIQGGQPQFRAARLASLAASVRHAIVQQPPPGAHWAVSTGCGTRVERTAAEVLAAEKAGRVILDGIVGCGMGHVPRRSQRFLHFFAKRC